LLWNQSHPFININSHNDFGNFYGATPHQGSASMFDPQYPQHYRLSTSNPDNSPFGIGDKDGYSENFWKKASYGDDDATGAYHATNNPNGRRSQSSGWFIDKIEGFRRTKAAWKNFGKIKPLDPGGNDWTGYGTHHEDNLYEYNGVGTSGQYVYDSVYYTTSESGPFGPSNQMQLEGTCTIGSRGNTWANYLDLSGAKGPHNTLLYDYTLSGGSPQNKGTGLNFVGGAGQAHQPHAFMLDNGIIPSQGIHENVIHLSYSGIGNNELGTGNSGLQYNDTSNNYFEYESIVAQNHVSDIEFINTITTPGTIWRWKEDPGQCLYQTQRYNPTSDSSYVLGEFDFNVDGGTKQPSRPDGIPTVTAGDAPASTSGFDIADDFRNSLTYQDGSAVVQDNGLWNYNTFDHAEGQNQLGIALYNIASFLDYPVDNPTQTGFGSLIGGYNYFTLLNVQKANMKFCSAIYVEDTSKVTGGTLNFSKSIAFCAPWVRSNTNAISSPARILNTHKIAATANNNDLGNPSLVFNSPNTHHAVNYQ